MTNHDNLIAELQSEMRKQGIAAESITITKNGVECRAIQIRNKGDRVCPVIYYSEQETVTDILARIRSVLQMDLPSLDIHQTMDPEYIRDHVYLGIQKQGDEELVKKTYLNTELFLRVYLTAGNGQIGSYKVTPGLLAATGLPEEELWMLALNHTRARARIRNMADLLPVPDCGGNPLLVGDAEQLQEGACILAFPEVFRSYCTEHAEEQLIILPSSTQEVIILPGSGLNQYFSVEDLAGMVASVNEAEVDPKLQLDPVVYRYSLAADLLEIAGMAGKEVL